MGDIAYFSSGPADKGLPRKLIKHCIVCTKKKELIFYCSTNDFILQVCNKCLYALGEENE